MPISNSAATSVSALRYAHARPGTVPVLVKRDSGFMGAACSTRLYVDGELVAYLGAGEKVILNVPVGEVIIGAEPGGMCAGGLVEREARLTSERRIAFRIGIDHTGSMGLYRTSAK